jgi:curved DNA-binding protein CbpA
MVKADAKRNYYADLELTPAADTEEVKRQFRKLGALYHTNRGFTVKSY